MNKKIAILLPILLALTFCAGMVLQKKFAPLPDYNLQKTTKLEYILRLIQSEYVEDVDIDVDTLLEDFYSHLFEKLDPHSTYISAEEYRNFTDAILGSFEGIGVQFNIQRDTVVIVQVLKGGPSEKLHILAGDRIVTVNDSVIAGNGITNEKVVKLLKGPSGTKVSVGIKRFGIDSLIPFKITRGAIPIESVTASYMLNQNTGYVAFDCFSQSTYEEFMMAVKKLRQKGAENLIIDLRENGGGLLFTAIDLANEFLDKEDVIVYTKGRKTPPEYFYADGMGSLKDMNLAVIIDEYSASASEVFSGAIQDNGRGVIVGRRSFGKGVVNEDFPLQDGSVIRLTTKKFYTPSGRCIQKPYNGNIQDYDSELIDRYNHGELQEIDSINFPDSLQFVTKTGKIVYGGGGIMPDVFVPIDSTDYTEAFRAISITGFVYDFAFDFSEKNRSKLVNMEFHDAYDYCKQVISWELLNSEANETNKSLLSEINKKERELALKLACCYVIRNIFGNAAFYELYNADDKTILKALEQFK